MDNIMQPEADELVQNVRDQGEVVVQEFSRFMNAVLRRLRTEVETNRPRRQQQQQEDDSKDNSSKFQKIGKNKAYQSKIYNKKTFGK